MKNIFRSLVVAIAMLALSCGVFAQSYPYTNPTYQPNPVGLTTVFSAPGNYLFQPNGISVASIQVTGTCTGLTSSVQVSNDNANWITIDATQVGTAGGNSFNISSPGLYRADVAGYAKIRLNITALSASCSVTMAGTQVIGDLSADPCQDSTVLKQNAAVNVGASTTAAIIPAVAGKKVFVCGFSASTVGTNPTFTFKSGTQTSTACDTGTATISGAINVSATVGTYALFGDYTSLTAPASNQVCLNTAATTSVQGVVNYVQQ